MEGCRQQANISFTTDIDNTILASNILFVAVDTPSTNISTSEQKAKDKDKFKFKLNGRKANLQRL